MSKNQTPACVKKTTIGGQAILEGIVMKGPKRTCVVVRKPDGTLVTEERPTSQPKSRFWKLPVCRGAYSLFTAMKDGLADIDYSSQFIEDGADEKPSKFEQWLERKLGSEKLEKAVTAFAMVLGIAIPVALFMLLPSFVGGLLPADVPNVARNLFEGLLRIVIFLCFMWSVSHMEDIRRTFEYHGAEHKTIFCYEAGLPLTVENVRKMPRFHPRCGTSFLFVLIIVATLVSSLIFSLVTVTNPFLRALTHLIILPLVVGISYECNRYAGRHDNLLCRVLRWPGLMIQRLTVFEPDDSMIEVAIEGMQRVIPEDDSDVW
ncbi:MAG: DUF1385 domain-containing protein [Clostridiaceae bacterium]|nr:DUF1385 domain-containing protein [Clostridiaceae bacterium]